MLQIKDLGCAAGVVLNPGTSLASIEYVLDGTSLFSLLLSPLTRSTHILLARSPTTGVYALERDESAFEALNN